MLHGSRSRTAGVAASLALLVALPSISARVAGAAAPGAPAARSALLFVDRYGASAMLPDGTARSTVPWLLPGDTGLAVSPSGRRIAFSSTRSGNSELYVADVTTGALKRLTWTARREDVEPAWSPDGAQLVWASGTARDHDLLRIRVDRPRVVELTAGPSDDREPAWSPDGRTIAFASNLQGAYDLWTVTPRGEAPLLLVDVEGNARAPDWHPSGARLAYTGVVGARADVWVATLDGAAARLFALPGYDGRPDWSPDGRSLAFVSGERGVVKPWRVRHDGVGAAPVPGGASVLDVAWNVLDGALAPARTALPPDLDQRAPSDLVVRGEGRRYVLGFTSATDNVGLGPVWLWARRSPSSELMAVEQLLVRENGSSGSLPGVGVLRYELHPPHRHWHLDDFVRYELRGLDGDVLVRDRKSGFCLVDRWGRAERPGLPTPSPQFLGDCGSRQPGAFRVEQGTSVGYTDRYPAFFHGQDLELTGLPPGLYLLVQTANPEQRLRELSYANNAASLLLRLTWPAGPHEKPRVDVLRRCTSSPRCLSPGGS